VKNQNIAQTAFRFVLIIGIVNLFADLTYEGGRSIAGPFLGSLGASATAIGFVAGFGELMGFGLRSVFGYLGDKSHKYWPLIFVGYAINMLAVPALALAGNWPMAAALLILERTGRAIRRPNVEALLSHAGQSLGSGWIFGFNEALDQSGATLGPLVVALVLYLHGGYQHAFGVLLFSALLCLGTVVVARVLYPRPHELEERTTIFPQAKSFSKSYWSFFIAGAFIAMGFADFSLIAFHFQKTGTVSPSLIPVFYSVAMAMGAIAALVFGRLLDKHGRPVLLLAFFLSALFAPCVFWGNFPLALLGAALWGIGLGAQDSLFKAVLTGIIPSEKRAMGYGLFDTGFGIAWFVGSAIMGLLYDRFQLGVVIFSVVLQLAALPFLSQAPTKKAAAAN
jgi:MFS family permease